jgi:hypothetical protein
VAGHPVIGQILFSGLLKNSILKTVYFAFSIFLFGETLEIGFKDFNLMLIFFPNLNLQVLEQKTFNELYCLNSTPHLHFFILKLSNFRHCYNAIQPTFNLFFRREQLATTFTLENEHPNFFSDFIECRFCQISNHY